MSISSPFARRASRKARKSAYATSGSRERRGADGGDDFGIGRAAAQIAREVVANLVVARVRNAIEQLARHHDETRRAEPALERGMFEKCGLHRVEPIAVGEMLDRLNGRAVGERRQE